MTTTVREVLDLYVQAKVGNGGSVRTFKHYFNVFVRYGETVLDKSMETLTLADCRTIQYGKLVQDKWVNLASTNGQGNLMLTMNVLHSLWRFAIKRLIIVESPFPGLPIVVELRALKKQRGQTRVSRKMKQE